MNEIKGYYYDGTEIKTIKRKMWNNTHIDGRFFVAPSLEDLITHKEANYNYNYKNAEYKKDFKKIDIINENFDSFMEAVESYEQKVKADKK